MSRGKPKRIQRGKAEKQTWIMRKLATSEFGAADVAERNVIESILLTESLVKWVTDKQLPFDDVWEEVDAEIAEAFKTAAFRLDAGFFRRCGEVIEWIREGRPLADEIGLYILKAIIDLMWEKRDDEKIRSPELVQHLDRFYPRATVYVDRDVRKVAKALGLGRFPLSVRDLRRDNLDEISCASKRRFAIARGEKK